MANIAIAIDRNNTTTDRQTLNYVINQLKSAGHTITDLGIGPNKLQSYGLKSASKGKIGVLLLNGVGQVTAGDFYEGVGSYYHYSKVIFAAQAWLWSKQDCSAFNKVTNEHDWNGSSSFKKKYAGKTFAQVCEMSKGRVDWCCSKSKEELANKIIAKIAGQDVDGTTSSTTIGYDTAKPLQCCIQIDYSTSNDSKLRKLILDFTSTSTDDYAHTGLTPVLINNVVRQSMINVVDLMRSDCGDSDEELRFYVHRVSLIQEVQKDNYYSTDGSNTDESSCKMDLYGFGFNNGTLINPLDLNSCGKTIISQMSELISKSGYLLDMNYGRHRRDDIINFKVDNKLEPSFVAQEGDDNNILKFSSISYTPISNLFNSSIQVFKNKDGQYQYAETKDSDSVLKYGQMTTLVSSSDIIGSKEAYYRCINNDNFEPNQQFSYSITVPFAQDIRIGDLVQVKSNDKKINTIKRVESVKYSFSVNQIPKIHTELGLDELSPDLQLRKQLREMRKSAKTESTLFSSSAKKIEDPDIYRWEY